jgi:hypothetical protein
VARIQFCVKEDFEFNRQKDLQSHPIILPINGIKKAKLPNQGNPAIYAFSICRSVRSVAFRPYFSIGLAFSDVLFI